MRALGGAVLLLAGIGAAAARSYEEVERDLIRAVREVRRIDERRAAQERRARWLEREVEAATRDGGLISTLTLSGRKADLHEAWADVRRCDGELRAARARVERLRDEALEIDPGKADRVDEITGRTLERARARLAEAEAARARGDATDDDVAAARRAVDEARRAHEAALR